MSETTTRKRRLGPYGHGHQRIWIKSLSANGAESVQTTVDASVPSVSGTQITVSEGHPWQSSARKGGRSTSDIGGDFYSLKQYVEGEDETSRRRMLTDKVDVFSTFPTKYVKTDYYYADVPLYPLSNSIRNAPSVTAFPPSGELTNSDLDQRGATAVSRCKPTNSIASLSVFLGELHKDGLPRLLRVRSWKNAIKAIRDAGEEFLNVEFGWKPLVSDVRSTAEAVRKGHSVLQQFERDAGKVVRRNYKFPREVTRDVTTVSTNTRPYYGNGQASWVDLKLGLGNIERVRETTRSVWFSGAFTYHLPTGYDSRNKLDRAALEAKLVFGLELTPETLWNLAPWSWAVDWFSNVGDVLSNVSSWIQYGLIMRYGYVMCHTVVRDTYTFRPTSGSTFSDTVPPLTLVTETKQRRRANPFGFGVSWSGLTSTQAAIAAAIGLTR